MPEQIQIKAIEDSHASYKKRRPNRAHPPLHAIRSDGAWIEVRSIEDYWKINDEWWRDSSQEIERIYFDVILDSNQRLTIFRDLVRNEWFRQAE